MVYFIKRIIFGKLTPPKHIKNQDELRVEEENLEPFLTDMIGMDCKDN